MSDSVIWFIVILLCSLVCLFCMLVIQHNDINDLSSDLDYYKDQLTSVNKYNRDLQLKLDRYEEIFENIKNSLPF